MKLNTKSSLILSAKPSRAPHQTPPSDRQHDRLVRTGVATIGGALVGGLAALGCSATQFSPHAPNVATSLLGMFSGAMAGGVGGMKVGEKLFRDPNSKSNDLAFTSLYGATATAGAAAGALSLGALSMHLPILGNTLLSAAIVGGFAAAMAYNRPE